MEKSVRTIVVGMVVLSIIGAVMFMMFMKSQRQIAYDQMNQFDEATNNPNTSVSTTPTV